MFLANFTLLFMQFILYCMGNATTYTTIILKQIDPSSQVIDLRHVRIIH